MPISDLLVIVKKICTAVPHGRIANGIRYEYTRMYDDGVYHNPLGQFSVVDIFTVGIVSVPKCRRWKRLAESFLTTHRSV